MVYWQRETGILRELYPPEWLETLSQSIVLPGQYRIRVFQPFHEFDETGFEDCSSEVRVMRDRVDGECWIFEGIRLIREWPLESRRFEGRSWDILILENITPIHLRWRAPFRAEILLSDEMTVYGRLF